MDQAIHMFGRQAISMTWDYAETPSLSISHAGGLTVALKTMTKTIPSGSVSSVVSLENAQSRSYSGMTVSTDPPYYDNIGYADLADFFYVWLRRSSGRRRSIHFWHGPYAKDR